MSIMDIPRAKELIALLRRDLRDKTVSHCVFTAEFMSTYVEQLGVDPEQAITAGLLHDFRKNLNNDEMLRQAHEYGIHPNNVQRHHPLLLHGPIAAETCRRELGINNDTIYDAIYWHTTGRANWSHLGLALYFADYAEPLRFFPHAVEAREILRRNGFWPALRFAVEKKFTHIKTHTHIDPTTVEFHEWLATLPA